MILRHYLSPMFSTVISTSYTSSSITSSTTKLSLHLSHLRPLGFARRALEVKKEGKRVRSPLNGFLLLATSGVFVDTSHRVVVVHLHQSFSHSYTLDTSPSSLYLPDILFLFFQFKSYDVHGESMRLYCVSNGREVTLERVLIRYFFSVS